MNIVSDFRKRMELLAHLGWEHGKPPSEYAKTISIWHFGSCNGKPIPGRAPYHVPTRKIAMFLVHYAPAKFVSFELRKQLIKEWGV